VRLLGVVVPLVLNNSLFSFFFKILRCAQDDRLPPAAAQGALFDDSHQLSRLIRRPTTWLSTAVADALRKLTVPS
jgi:hypothetical protein